MQPQVERDPYCAEVIQCRIADGLAAPGTLFHDITECYLPAAMSATLDGIVGGFPCQAIRLQSFKVSIE